MHKETLLPATLFSEGRFQAAIVALSQRPARPDERISGSERLLLAELLERTGRLAEVKTELAALRKTPRLTESERARYFLVEGLVSKQMGHLQDSVRAFLHAWKLAEKNGSPELAAWCQLRLLSASADLDGAQLDANQLSALRSSVERAASPSVSIAHQIFLAEYLAKRGDLDASRRHSSVAEALLRSFPNYWLRGLLDLHESCLSYLEGDFLESLVSARHALATSLESGHQLTGVIALADMAAAYLAVGQAARATACLAGALRRSNREEQIWGLVLETLAEAQLIGGDVEGCAESLRTARELSTLHAQLRSAWHRAWNLRTEVRLLQREGRWKESLAVIRSARPANYSDSRSFPRLQIEALEARALSRLRRPAEVAAVIRGYVSDRLEKPRSTPSVTLATSGALLAFAAGEGDALSLCIHALRIVGATGETSSLIEIVDQLIELTDGATQTDTEVRCIRELDPVWRPTNVVCHLDATTSVLPALESDGARVVRFLCCLADLTGDPQALGEEALRQLVLLGWITSGAVVQWEETEVSPVVTVEFRVGTTQGKDFLGRLPADSVRVPLGARQKRSFEAVLCPKESAVAVSGCLGFARLLSVLRRSPNPEFRASATGGRGVEEPSGNDNEGLFRSSAMLALVASARRVAPLDITVLLTGESGTGKEVIANIIHRASGAAEDAFVAFNCSTVPRDMVDSQLFGYRRGSFTGAVQGFRGVINAAEGGTLLLDEVGELPLEIQPKLLRFLDTGEVQTLGEASPRKVRVRVIAATNANLEELVQQRRFREDLFYRLNVVRFRLPPLRERREEIGPLVSMFLSRYSTEFGKHGIVLSEAAREHLLLYHWPGNVRELSHEVRRIVALADSESVVDVLDLDARIRGMSRESIPTSVSASPSLRVRVDRTLADITREVESAAIVNAIEASKGRLDLAAKRLGLSRKGLYLKRQRLGFL